MKRPLFFMHKHKAKKTATVTHGFTGCVNPEQCNPAAHGNVTDAETCHCGWQRSVNINQGHIEKSRWRAPWPAN